MAKSGSNEKTRSRRQGGAGGSGLAAGSCPKALGAPPAGVKPPGGGGATGGGSLRTGTESSLPADFAATPSREICGAAPLRTALTADITARLIGKPMCSTPAAR